jgi:hypothetical protein
MLAEMANWATIILMLVVVNIVWQLEKASKLLNLISHILIEVIEENDK